MADITEDWGSGGRNQNPKDGGGDQPSQAQALRDVADDVELLRAQLAALNAKLDADAGVTDTDYASTLDIATSSIKTKKV